MNTPGNPMMFSNNDASPDNSFAINSKIMIVAVVVLFGVVMFILGLHIYAKWFWRHGAQNGSSGGWRRRRRLEFAADWPGQQRTTQVGLEKSVIDQLPTFTHSEEKEKAATLKEGGGLECAVCLEEFAEGEKGRLLPKCNHSFHIDCIDMWFHTHSTCPLCRCSVGPETTSPANPTIIPPLEAFLAPSGTLVTGMPREGVLPSGDAAIYIDANAGVSAFPDARAYHADNHNEGLQPAGSAATVVASVEHGTGFLPLQDVAGVGAGGPSPRPNSVVAHQQQQQQQQASRPESPSSRRSSTALSPKPPSIQYPANVLFWGNQTQMNVYSGTAGVGVGVPAPREENSGRRPSGVHAPNALMIEIPRALPLDRDSNVGAAHNTSCDESHRASDAQGGPKSPIGRLVTSSFRRLLSIRRGPSSPGPESTCSSYDLEQGSTNSSSAGAVHQRQSQS